MAILTPQEIARVDALHAADPLLGRLAIARASYRKAIDGNAEAIEFFGSDFNLRAVEKLLADAMARIVSTG